MSQVAGGPTVQTKGGFLAAMKEGGIQSDYDDIAKKSILIPEDVFPIPSGDIGYIKPAEIIFPTIAKSHLWFVRGGKVHELVSEKSEGARLSPLTNERAVSELERFAKDNRKRIARNEFVEKERKIYSVWRSANMPLKSMEILLETDSAREHLPEIRQIVACAVIVENQDGICEILSTGYHSHAGGTYVAKGETPPEIPIDIASKSLLRLHGEFSFCSASDLSRAIAVTLSPALKMGGFIREDFPMHVAEAAESQSGKDYLQKLHSRIYNERPAGIAPCKGGVGSIDETISKAMIQGRPFITFSNYRGRMESAILESAIRGQGRIECRALRTSASVDCTAFIWQLSTNGAEFTRDLANRSIITRIRKQPPGFNFTSYPEGDLLSHVEANQAYYLGCVFAIIREWIAQGKPRTTDTRHDFREWTQSLDWIVENLFSLPPLLDGHQEQQARTANPALKWLRDLGNTVIANDSSEKSMTAVDLVDICDDVGLDLPGNKDSKDLPQLRIGKILGKLFKEAKQLDENTAVLAVDGINIRRKTAKEWNRERGEETTHHHYIFAREGK